MKKSNNTGVSTDNDGQILFIKRKKHSEIVVSIATTTRATLLSCHLFDEKC